MNFIEIQNLDFSYANGLQVLSNLNLYVNKGEFVTIIGESGSGKSTIFRLLTGLEKIENGLVSVDGLEVVSPRSSTGIVFQKPSLIPWLNVQQNLEFGYRLRNESFSPNEIDNALVTARIEVAKHLKISELSGGMAQRVAIARSLIGGTNLLLMDEPFGALDALTRLKLQEELFNIWNSTGVTIVFITHDIDEAVYLSDRILIMDKNTKNISHIEKIDIKKPRNRNSEEYIKTSLNLKNKLFSIIKN